MHQAMSHPSKDPEIVVSLGLSYKTYTTSGKRNDPDDYILHMKGDIMGEITAQNNLPQTEIHLGSIKFSLIRVGEALNERMGMEGLFDVSQEICELAAELYEDDFEEFKYPIRKAFPEASTWDDILYFESLELHPFARGQRVGLSALHRAANDWQSGCALVVLQAHPLQYPNGIRDDEKWVQLGMTDSTPDFVTSKNKLQNYYKQLGFQKAGRSKYMFRCPAVVQTKVDVPSTIVLSRDTIKSCGNVHLLSFPTHT
jgi:GNAT superfamily N-acetyltransferase